MWRDDANLLDIVTWARRANKYAKPLTAAEFLTDSLIQDATIRCLLVVGEAAARISVGFRDAHPEVPWSRVIGMRNRLVHEYGHVDLTEVWTTATGDCLDLVDQLEPLLSPGADALPDEWEFL